MEAVQVVNQLKHIKSYVRQIYKRSVQAVNPKLLVKRSLSRSGDILTIRGSEYKIDHNCYVIGIGKAALDMALASEEIIDKHLRGGAVSIPEEMLSLTKLTMPKKIKVFEGAKGNLPDEKSMQATNYIVNILEKLTENDLLIVLISGGGSALFTSPVPPITLREKLFVTKILTEAGANILELNSVRKRLSLVKGGRLVKIAHPAKVVSLILSDVINDPLEFIASGPTVPDSAPSSLSLDVLKKYDLIKDIPAHVLEAINKHKTVDSHYFSNSVTHVIGNNCVALNAGENFDENEEFLNMVVTNTLQGQVDQVAKTFATLAGLVCQALGKTITNKVFANELQTLSNDLCINAYTVEELTKLLFQPSSKNKVCLFFGGETTVRVIGKGLGGRSQELALRFSIALDELSKSLHVIDLFNVVMLSAGTDGLDGPTDAAGAIAYNGQTRAALLQNINPAGYVKENDSYRYYSLLNNGEDQVKCGPTGTNVMDICILTVQSKI